MDSIFNDEPKEEKFTINRNYAAKFQKFKECQELDRLKHKYGDNVDDESSSESEDETAEALTPQLEEDFMATLSMIKSKDPNIYNKETIFYNEKQKNAENKELSTKEKQKKPVFLKDYERERLMTKGSQAYVSDSEDENGYQGFVENKNINELIYNEEQLDLKQSLKAAINNEESDTDDLLTVRDKTKDEKKKEDEEYKTWMKKEKKKNGGLVDQYWKEKSLDENETFLRDYILKRQYKEEDERLPTYKEVVGDLDTEDEDQEEEELNREDEFERKYNFRFEEPDQTFIKRYPRTIAESVRRQDDRRKQKRKDYEERKEKEKDKKKEELKKLKNLKRKEIMAKIDKLKQITGNNKIDDLEDDILDGDFDAAKYDKIMQQVFDNEYYDVEVDKEKPTFSDDDDGIYQEENWDEWTGTEEKENNEVQSQSEEQPHCEDPDFNMDAEYDPNAVVDKSFKRKKKMSKFAQAIKKKKPVFNPDEKTFEEYLDEYYKLDYEDIIEDLPVRFKYRTCMSNDFGLSTEEVLKAEDKELNSWCALRKTMRYNNDDEELRERAKYKKKARNRQKKKQMFNFLQKEEEEIQPEEPEYLQDEPDILQDEPGIAQDEPDIEQYEPEVKKKIQSENNIVTNIKNPPKLKEKSHIPSSASNNLNNKPNHVTTNKRNHVTTNKKLHPIQKKKNLITPKHSIHSRIRSNYKNSFSREKYYNKKTMDTLSTTKIKNLRKQFKGGDKDLVKKISTSRLAAYGLDKRKKVE